MPCAARSRAHVIASLSAFCTSAGLPGEKQEKRIRKRSKKQKQEEGRQA